MPETGTVSPHQGYTPTPDAIKTSRQINVDRSDSRLKSSCYDRKERTKSATVSRPRVSAPRRPVQSAGTCRQEELGRSNKIWHGCGYDSPAEDEDEEIGVEFPLSYDIQLKQHGWKMEIPGDPLKLK